MTAGWSIVLLRLLRALISSEPVYPAVRLPLALSQTGAILEVVHALSGLVRASAATTLLQVSSRLMLVWGVLDLVPEVRLAPTVTSMVLAWSLTEIPRYLYFSVAAATTQIPPGLTWLRYSTFIPLYPLGAGSEAATLYAALPYIEAARPLSVYMPNRVNFAFDYYYMCVLVLVNYLPGLPYMFAHMLRQRKKYVVSPAEKLVKAQ
ncbi:enoyl-CoA hydratase [Chondrus crispus]|uniref:very-long-chain (3R)-3-hydroxyacyl-CoA dehydratase n=1 Tax=Chondrus crispus TaxID=2769 RepID=R7QF60_CHOCR|nr:enoyl-CoA hydratase [Chondrus crispus]CDF36729.1 enoyl-CoA hydratase [Chondrus crispus]|eukprot:XP_005716548.1 enoyl-CoA hydratase [Chondrus crispus]